MMARARHQPDPRARREEQREIERRREMARREAQEQPWPPPLYRPEDPTPAPEKPREPTVKVVVHEHAPFRPASFSHTASSRSEARMAGVWACSITRGSLRG
jgi:hypothetical protein